LGREMKDKWAWVRRVVHLCTPLFLIYYFLPDHLWELGIDKRLGVLLVLIAALIFELFRLTRGIRVPGMRPYEAEQMSAAAWAAIALTITFLFFPLEYAAPVLFGMALVDPVIGVVRRTRYYPALPLAMYFTIALALLSLLIPLSPQVALAAVVAAVLAIMAESWKTSCVDDDFLMIVVPLLGIALILGF